MSRHIWLELVPSKLVREQDLQIADRVLLIEVAARVAFQQLATSIVHADEVTRLVQHRMQRCVETEVDAIADQTRFALAPVRARDRVT